jgi:hypothetical protein
MNYEPLIAGVLLPISTFINIQSITVPVWQYGPAVSVLKSGRSTGDEPFIVWIFANASLFCGIIANIALFSRMLEKKIKGNEIFVS